jgi:hypothetical protein
MTENVNVKCNVDFFLVFGRFLENCGLEGRLEHSAGREEHFDAIVEGNPMSLVFQNIDPHPPLRPASV